MEGSISSAVGGRRHCIDFAVAWEPEGFGQSGVMLRHQIVVQRSPAHEGSSHVTVSGHRIWLRRSPNVLQASARSSSAHLGRCVALRLRWAADMHAKASGDRGLGNLVSVSNMILMKETWSCKLNHAGAISKLSTIYSVIQGPSTCHTLVPSRST